MQGNKITAVISLEGEHVIAMSGGTVINFRFDPENDASEMIRDERERLLGAEILTFKRYGPPEGRTGLEMVYAPTTGPLRQMVLGNPSQHEIDHYLGDGK